MTRNSSKRTERRPARSIARAAGLLVLFAATASAQTDTGDPPAPGDSTTMREAPAARGILLKSDRLALLSPRQVQYELQTGLLVALDIPVPNSARAIGIMTLPDWQPTLLQAGFLQALRVASQSGASPA